MKLIMALLLATPLVYGKPAYLLIENSVGSALSTQLKSSLQRKKLSSKFSAVKIEEKFVEHLSHAIHEKFHKCGGFFHFETEAELNDFVTDFRKNSESAPKDFWLFDKVDTRRTKRGIAEALEEVKEVSIKETIEKLSSFKTRYYRDETGVSSAKWIASTWQKLVERRDDAKVFLFNHNSWSQPSVILQIDGESKESMVIGGHLDSISNGGAAPGADDNASGIATITEIIRVVSETGFRPKKTLLFIGYAAEEVGLRGSKEIAQKIVKDGEYKVAAALQFDMTNFKGSDKAIYLINDYTSENLTKYLGTLIDRYVKVPWGFTKCGYACSDHASWNAQGIPAAFPFEASFSEYNRKIHSANDKIDVSGGNAEHAVNFAKLGLAAVLDLGAL